MPVTVRNTGRRGPSVGLSAVGGALGGISKGAGTLGTYFEKKEERERRKPFEDMQMRSLTATTEAAEAKLKAQTKAAGETEWRKDEISSFMQSELYFEKPQADEIAEEIDNAPVSNRAAMETIKEPTLLEQLKTEEGMQKIVDESEQPIQEQAPTEEPAPGGVIPPGAQAPEKPVTTAYRPGDTGELEKVEPEPTEEKPPEIQRAEALAEELIRVGAHYDPTFKSMIAENQKKIDDWKASQAATAKAGEAERVRLEEFGLKERKLESDVEQKGLDRDAKAEQARLKREFDREDTAIKNQYAKDLADAKAKDPALKKVSVPIIKGITETGAALVRFKQLRKLLDENKVGVFERAFKFGSFTNPEVESAMSYLKNRLGRKDSGAAISATEWKVFEKLILDTKNLTSDKGRKVALAKIDQHIEDFGIFGTSLSGGDENWFSKYQKSADTAREKVVSEGDEDAELAALKAELAALEEEEE